MRKPNPKGIKSPLEHDGKTTGGHDYLLKHGDRQVEIHYQKDDHSQYDDGYGNDGPPDGTFLRDEVESNSNGNSGEVENLENIETKTTGGYVMPFGLGTVLPIKDYIEKKTGKGKYNKVR